MNDITDLFLKLIAQYRAIDIANAELRRMLDDDPALKEEYSQWCASVGSSEKMGFLDYCEEYMENQQSIYDNLNDFDE